MRDMQSRSEEEVENICWNIFLSESLPSSIAVTVREAVESFWVIKKPYN